VISWFPKVLSNANVYRYITSLDLSSNALTELPRAVSRLRAVRVLNLAYNKLTRLPSTIGASHQSTIATRRRMCLDLFSFFFRPISSLVVALLV
jgi:Leucine-rich repeat (LRR) protein